VGKSKKGAQSPDAGWSLEIDDDEHVSDTAMGSVRVSDPSGYLVLSGQIPVSGTASTSRAADWGLVTRRNR